MGLYDPVFLVCLIFGPNPANKSWQLYPINQRGCCIIRKSLTNLCFDHKLYSSSAAVFPFFPGYRDDFKNMNILFRNDLFNHRKIIFIHHQGNTAALTGLSRGWRNPGFDVSFVKLLLKAQPHFMIGE
jgi:hypothetical protein